MSKTITLNDVELESLTIARQGDSVRVDARFVYLDGDGGKVMIGESEARDYIRVTLPEDSPHLTKIMQFVTNMVLPFIREQKQLT